MWANSAAEILIRRGVFHPYVAVARIPENAWQFQILASGHGSTPAEALQNLIDNYPLAGRPDLVLETKHV